MLWVIIYRCCGALPYRLALFGWIRAVYINLFTLEFILLLPSAVTSSINSIRPVSRHNTRLHRVWQIGMLRIISLNTSLSFGIDFNFNSTWYSALNYIFKLNYIWNKNLHATCAFLEIRWLYDPIVVIEPPASEAGVWWPGNENQKIICPSRKLPLKLEEQNDPSHSKLGQSIKYNERLRDDELAHQPLRPLNNYLNFMLDIK